MRSSLSNYYLKFFLVFSFSLMILSLPLVTLAQYQLLEPSLVGGQDQDLNLVDYLKLIYRTVLMVVVVISILMVAIGGVEYIFSQVPGAKTEGKQRITNAIIGLLIGLSSYLILYTIDPSFVQFNLSGLKPVHIDASGSTPGGGSSNNGGSGTSGGGSVNHNLGALAGPRTENETNSQAILRNAQHAANTRVDTCNMPGTNGGTLACAGAVNNIVRAATGEPVGGDLSTANMYEVLQNNPKYQFIGEGNSGIASAQPGDIIIAPSTTGPNRIHGHVGICESVGCSYIISNQGGNSRVGREALGAYRQNHNEPRGIFIYRPLGP